MAYTGKKPGDVSLSTLYESGGALQNHDEVTVDASGNVGVGTASPSRKLHVEDLTADPFITVIGNTSSNGGILLGDPDNGGMGQMRYNNATESLAFATTTSVRMSVDADGLKFGTDTAAANALDDYEEGTWTPSATGGLNNISAHYVKIGKLVHCTFKASAVSATTGDWTGLPFTIRNTAGGGAVSYHNLNNNEAWQISCENINTTVFSLRHGYEQRQLTAGKNIWCSFTYHTD